MLKNKHLSFDDRKLIEKSLNNGLNFSQIGLNINKPYKTISNEIKRNRIFEASTAFSLCGSKLCDKLNKPPYVCNGCSSKNGCRRKNIITTQMMHKHHTMTEKVILEKELI